MSVQKMLMNWNAVYVFVLASCILLSLYIHYLQEWDAYEDYNEQLEKIGIKRGTDTNVNVEFELKEDIDVVFTWVNGSDPKFLRDLHTYLRSIHRRNTEVMELNRFYDVGTLKYSMRALEKYASWVRHVFLVTNGQIPNWLKRNHPRLTIVTHEELFTNRSHLPTFASPAIECHLHEIAGLSKRFIYMNDNILLTSNIQLSDFISTDGKYKIKFLTERPVMCNKLCRVNNVNNGICDRNCSTASCEFDGDDCIGQTIVKPYNETDKYFMFDSWMGSIVHTYFLLNKLYGPKNRYLSDHAAQLFDKTIMHALYNRFPDEWELTSSHKIRNHLSIQYQFVFMQYLRESGLIENTTDTKNVTGRKCCSKVKFIVDNRAREDRKKQIEVLFLEMELKKSQYLIVTNNFNMAISNERKAEIERDVENFLNILYPNPSSFEK